MRYSVRRLLHPPPASYPRELLINCKEPLSQTHPCNEDPCVVDCKLGDWTPFSDGPCSVTCGVGFQVERRRVVEGPVGKGKLCPPHNELDVRVRYKACKGKEEMCKPRCDLAPKATLYGSCSNVCNNEIGGFAGKEKEVAERHSVRVIRRKDKEAALKTCSAEYKKVPCGVNCDRFNFFPSETGRLPRMGKWTEMVAVFFLDEIAEAVVLEAPEGFELGKQKGMVQNEKGQQKEMELCLLKSHNLPRLKRCTVKQDGGSSSMKFHLFNALEGFFTTRSGKTRRQMYEVRFWVKPPGQCPGGFDEKGVCKVADDVWHWKLHSWSNELGSNTVGDEDTTFKVYSDQAKDFAPVAAEKHDEEDIREENQDFLIGVQEKREERKAAQSGKKGEKSLKGHWKYVGAGSDEDDN